MHDHSQTQTDGKTDETRLRHARKANTSQRRPLHGVEHGVQQHSHCQTGESQSLSHHASPSPKMMTYAQVPSLMRTNVIDCFPRKTARPEILLKNLKSVRAKSVVSKANGRILMSTCAVRP